LDQYKYQTEANSQRQNNPKKPSRQRQNAWEAAHKRSKKRVENAYSDDQVDGLIDRINHSIFQVVVGPRTLNLNRGKKTESNEVSNLRSYEEAKDTWQFQKNKPSYQGQS